MSCHSSRRLSVLNSDQGCCKAGWVSVYNLGEDDTSPRQKILPWLNEQYKGWKVEGGGS